MNKKIGMVGSLISLVSVILFAIFMLMVFNFGSFLVCMFLALGFVMMIGAFVQECKEDKKAAAYVALVCVSVYCMLILLVYFAQTTSIRLEEFSEELRQVFDYTRFGLYFNYDLLGYGMMALTTFFIGLTINVSNKKDKWLKWLLIIHGVFFIPCLIMPMFGIFLNGNSNTGVIALELWCIYFMPICFLTYKHFEKCK